MLADDWFVVATEPRAEATVSGRAADLDIPTYVPVARHLARGRGRKAELEARTAPVFAGYVFVFGRHFANFRREYDAPDAVPHCIGFLHGSDGPEPVAQAVVEDLKRREADGEFDAAERAGRYWAPRYLRPRARVRIIEGPFKGTCGEVWRLTRARRVAIWLMVMGRPTLTECPIEAVARAEKTVARGPKGKYD